MYEPCSKRHATTQSELNQGRQVRFCKWMFAGESSLCEYGHRTIAGSHHLSPGFLVTGSAAAVASLTIANSFHYLYITICSVDSYSLSVPDERGGLFDSNNSWQAIL